MSHLINLRRANLEGINKEARDSLLKEFSASLTERVLKSPNFDEGVESIVQELKSLGHDLYLFDADFDVDIDADESSQSWCGDWTKPEGSSTPLIVTFHSVKGVELEWSAWAEK